MAKVSPKTEQKPHERTDEEIERLAKFMDILIEMGLKQKKLHARLKDEPKGFAVQGTVHCATGMFTKTAGLINGASSA